jgi:hypothetical protein
MHLFGITHGDLKWQNILINPRQTGEQITLLDLDGSRRAICRPFMKPAKDLERFLRDLRETDQDEIYRGFFLRIWRRWSAPPSPRTQRR